ncbi:MAG: hypothetical protein Q8S13_04670, partial [Dehalococcoidia bacterium]|nr:hypothetical protein [Dehalococcoidia bacterium]
MAKLLAPLISALGVGIALVLSDALPQEAVAEQSGRPAAVELEESKGTVVRDPPLSGATALAQECDPPPDRTG